ncbi:MAG: hypothetical protein MRQ09_02795 [Candidatus Midichloria sp.]|nr:hypothetical protein [Candidatus Midichloria sp.]
MSLTDVIRVQIQAQTSQTVFLKKTSIGNIRSTAVIMQLKALKSFL